MWILLLLLETFVSAHQDSGWQLARPTSTRAYLHLPHSASWTQAEDRCQQLYGHLARDDSAGELREFITQEKIGGQVWIGLHQWAPADAFHWVDDFSWTDVDIPSSSVWGEYVEEYEMALCVSLDIDYGYRWDTRYCQGEEIAGSICQIEVPTWIHQENCNTSRLLQLWIKNHSNFNLKYFPDNETLEAECLCGETVRKSTICSIDERFQEVFLPCCDDDDTTEGSLGTESTVSSELVSSTHQNYTTEKSGPTTKLPVPAITRRQGKQKQTQNLPIAKFTASQPEKYRSTVSPPENSTSENIIIETSSPTNQEFVNKSSLTSSKRPNVSNTTIVAATSVESEKTVVTSTTFNEITSSISPRDTTTPVNGSISPTSSTRISGPKETSTQILQRPKRQSPWLSTRVRTPKRKPATFRKSYQGRVSNRQPGRG